MKETLRAINIWIGEKEELNKGSGTQMMNLAINRCFEAEEVKSILIDPLTSNQKRPGSMNGLDSSSWNTAGLGTIIAPSTGSAGIGGICR